MAKKEKRALVISGGGSKGAFAGGITKFLIEDKQYDYDIILGTSTGSLMVIHLALEKIKDLHRLSNEPFLAIIHLKSKEYTA